MTLNEFLELVKLSKEDWKIVDGVITPSPIVWLADNLGKGKSTDDDISRALALGLSVKVAWSVLQAIEYPNTSNILIRMELERLCEIRT